MPLIIPWIFSGPNYFFKKGFLSWPHFESSHLSCHLNSLNSSQSPMCNVCWFQKSRWWNEFFRTFSFTKYFIRSSFSCSILWNQHFVSLLQNRDFPSLIFESSEKISSIQYGFNWQHFWKQSSVVFTLFMKVGNTISLEFLLYWNNYLRCSNFSRTIATVS